MSRSALAAVAVLICAGFAGCATVAQATAETTPVSNAVNPFPSWTDADRAYRFFPGDEVEVSVLNAPELNRTVRIAPDGRLQLPLVAPVMAANRTPDELRAALEQAYTTQLRAPEVQVAARGFASQQVFVGGEVARPGVFELPAGMDPMQAVLLAGGFLPSARPDAVVIYRRLPNGETLLRPTDLSPRAVRRGLPGDLQLNRFDVIYVPRSPISRVGLFMQQYVREALPINFGVAYNLNDPSR